MKARDFKKKFKVKSTPSVLPRNILNAETRRRGDAEKEKQKNSGRERGAGAFLCFGSFGSRYWLRNFPVTHLTCFLFFASKPNRFIAFARTSLRSAQALSLKLRVQTTQLHVCACKLSRYSFAGC